MPFPPYPPWQDRREALDHWDLHLDRHNRNQEALEQRRAEHRREHDRDDATYQRERAEHGAAHALERATLETRLAEHDRAHQREHTMTQLALDKAEVANEKRFEGVNAFRQTLTDQALTFARSETMEARFQAIAAHQATAEDNLNQRRDTLASQLDARLTALETFQHSTQGQDQGHTDLRTVVIGGVLLAISTLGLASSILLHFVK